MRSHRMLEVCGGLQCRQHAAVACVNDVNVK
eukprot:SAG11_NODE_34552_length_271_cov_0.866279_1_plen_30_part_01